MNLDLDNPLQKLVVSLVNKNENEINKYKYEALWDGDSLLDIALNYVFLCKKLGIDFDFGKSRIEKGMIFYRIRRFEDGVDFSNKKEWEPSPFKKMNRANLDGETALYLASEEFICKLETHLKENEKYILGRYECIESFDAGGFLSVDMNNSLHSFASAFLNACLIAPARDPKNDALFSYLETKFGNLNIWSLGSAKDNLFNGRNSFILPFKIGYVIQKNTYKLTNELSNILKKTYPKAIRYSSCYVPIEGGGFVSNAFNLAVFEKGLSNFKWISHEIKTNSKFKDYPLTDVNVAKMVMEGGERHE